jgi:uncharacterized membrane protein YphA (DoxX/SURF4 family)
MAPIVRALTGAAQETDRATPDFDRFWVLRPLFVVLQGATVLITWPLWQTRADPPLLPMFKGLPQFDMGLLVLATLALTLVRPKVGVLAHITALSIAFAQDQTRLQPEFVSLALILLGTTTISYSAVLVRAHLVSLWFWSGLNKALSLDFMGGAAQFIYGGLPVRIEAIRPYFGWLVIASEMLAAVFIVLPKLRRIGVALAVGVHLMILLVLLRHRWNVSVWPWNVAVPLAAIAFFGHSSSVNAPRANRAIATAFAGLILVLPAGFYAGYVDAYLAHNLYTSNTAWAVADCGHDPPCSSVAFSKTWNHFRVPLPPEPRLYRAYFDQLCGRGDTLVIYPRQTRVIFGRDTTVRTHECRSP